MDSELVLFPVPGAMCATVYIYAPGYSLGIVRIVERLLCCVRHKTDLLLGTGNRVLRKVFVVF